MEVSFGEPIHHTVVVTASITQFSVLLYFELINIFCVQVNFEDEARIKFLKLLGFSKDELEKKVFCLCFLTAAVS